MSFIFLCPKVYLLLPKFLIGMIISGMNNGQSKTGVVNITIIIINISLYRMT